ncbi:thioredoxin-related transmembrane protein 1 [Biomphalaria pfeifferi]|uniref:Thioredoxin-related transmembrane protein 1 n=1 Tax=Biomphalaria pfeifferi TaxID=112525 RepID=A0AAD8B411_BIOPF|nr:thioredoxin-related transmembrane protein 1 [Biomphalaria pfeifferi]
MISINCYLVSLLYLLHLLANVSSQSYKTKEPIKITDSNWTNVLEGEWMVEFMAPWCPACKSFKDVWTEFAGWGYDLDITVGVIDVTENPGLSGRFLVTSLPTLYHVKDGNFRIYQGGRKTTDLISLIDEKKWNAIEPVAWYRNPNSIQMGILGNFFTAAMFIRGIYNTMTDVYGIPEWLCYVIFAILTIIIGLILGLLLVLCCDNFFPAKYIPLPPERLAHKPKDDPTDDDDIIDDTVEQKQTKKTALDSKGPSEPSGSASQVASDSEVRKRTQKAKA